MMSSLEAIRPAKSACRFCEYLKSAGDNEPINTPWLLNNEFGALISIGALVPGWTLVCPVNHQINMSNQYEKDAFWEIASKVHEVLRQAYGEIRIFEHGAQFDQSATGCGANHAHLHFVPLDFSLATEAMAFDEALKWEPCLLSEIEIHTSGREYLFVADHFNENKTPGFLSLLNVETSQFFRKVIAHRLGKPEFYDYRKYSMLDIGGASLKHLRLIVASDVKNGTRIAA